MADARDIVRSLLQAKLETEDESKPKSPHGSEFQHVGRADLKAQGFKPKGRGSGNSQHEAALVAWKHAQSTNKQASAVIGGRGWAVLGHGEKVAYGQPHMTITPEGVLHAYKPSTSKPTSGHIS